MDWINRLNATIDYIESNLTEKIELEELSKIACCSSYHFQRMFSYIADVPLAEYIKRRRMSLATNDLLAGEKVIDVAIKYTYTSPTAFNRAFQSVIGIAPSKVNEGTNLITFPPLSFKLILKGAEKTNYRIENKSAFRIVGRKKDLPMEVEKAFEIVPQMWRDAANEMLPMKLVPLNNIEPSGILGVSNCFEDGNYSYFISVASDKENIGEFDSYIVGEYTWAVFSGSGPMPHAIQDLEKRIVMEWLPTSGYEYDKGPDIEVYLNPDPMNAEFEVWIPVRKVEN